MDSATTICKGYFKQNESTSFVSYHANWNVASATLGLRAKHALSINNLSIILNVITMVTVLVILIWYSII